MVNGRKEYVGKYGRGKNSTTIYVFGKEKKDALKEAKKYLQQIRGEKIVQSRIKLKKYI